MKALRAAAAAAGVVTLLAAPACDDDEPASEPSPSGPLVVHERSGGIAGIYERLDVGRDGSTTLTVGIVDRHRTEFRISDPELDRLTEELEAADFDAVESGDAEGCADCFTHEVEYAGRKTTIVAEVNEPPESVSSVTAHLGELIADHYPPGSEPLGVTRPTPANISAQAVI